MSQSSLPVAVVEPERRWTWAWLVPIAAVVFALYIGYEIWSQRGETIHVLMSQGHGLEDGAALRHRGIVIGEVQSITLTSDAQQVRAKVRINSDQAGRIARAGSRFWVVRPQLGLGELSGLETIVGARYLAVHPGGGSRQETFTAIADPPVVTEIDPGDLQVLVRGSERSGMRRGAVVTYRGIPVGAVLSVGLTSDAGAVEARVLIYKQYAQLIRPQTRFWSTSDISVEAGITGMRLTLHSIESLLTGGLALATPPGASEVVRTGHRFELDDAPEDAWLEWQPQVGIGSRLLPAGAPLPAPQSARLLWRQGRLIKSGKSRTGWVLPTKHGVIAPLDLLMAAERADEETIELHVAGREFLMPTEPSWSNGLIGRSEIILDGFIWPLTAMREATEAEDCLVFGDPSEQPLPIAASRFRPAGENSWQIEGSLSADRAMHGAVVVGRSDGRVIGLLLVDEDDDEPLRVALLPASLIQGEVGQ